MLSSLHGFLTAFRRGGRMPSQPLLHSPPSPAPSRDISWPTWSHSVVTCIRGEAADPNITLINSLVSSSFFLAKIARWTQGPSGAQGRLLFSVSLSSSSAVWVWILSPAPPTPESVGLGENGTILELGLGTTQSRGRCGFKLGCLFWSGWPRCSADFLHKPLQWELVVCPVLFFSHCSICL